MTRLAFHYTRITAIAVLFIISSIVPSIGLAQTGADAFVSGKVVDSVGLSPLAGGSVELFRKAGRSPVTGVVLDSAGRFRLAAAAGTYLLRVKHIGYEDHVIADLALAAGTTRDLGVLILRPSGKVLEEVVVQAQKSSMQLSLDKKVFNVGLDLANAGGSAVDILSNVPSVSVDPEGNVKLRGSDNVRILIDGKPSGLVSLKGGSGLQQLQANLVEKVEIITNPSARYEAEGVGGVINIILKKEKQNGFNGSVELVTGTPTNFGAAANFNYRHRRFNFFINYGINYRVIPYVSSLYQEVYERDTSFLLKQRNTGEQIGFNNNIRGGLDYFFTEKSILTASYMYRRSKGQRITDIEYRDYLFSLSNPTGITYRRQDENETEPNSEYTLSYKRSFARKGHELTAEAKYIDNWENSDQVFTQRGVKNDGSEDLAKKQLQLSVNDEYEKQWLFQLDYVKPVGTDGKFETGVRSSFRDMVNDYIVTQQDASGNFNPLPGLDNVFLYDENIHAMYGIFGNKSGRFSYQGGVRAEWTDVETTLKETNEVNPRNYMNLFPSAHLTMELKSENAMQLSYSRRVRRPFYNDLSPFMTYSDSRNFFSGNPDLEPEFSDVMEIGHIKTFDKGSFTSSLYYRDTKGKITSIRLVDEQGNSVTQPENLLRERAFGAEFTSAYTPISWWKLDVNMNFFYADIDGSNIRADYKTNTYSWFARQTSRFMFKNNFDVQLRANYEAAQRTAQGKRKGLFYADFSMSKDVFKGKGTLNLNILDVLNSRRYRSVSEGVNFFTDIDSQYRRRQVNLSLSYRIRQSKMIAKPKLGEE